MFLSGLRLNSETFGYQIRTLKFYHMWAASWQNQHNNLCAQRRLRSAWASAQSDQSLRFPHGESSGPCLSTKRTAKTDQTGRKHRLILVFAWRTFHFVGFVVLRFICGRLMCLKEADGMANCKPWPDCSFTSTPDLGQYTVYPDMITIVVNV